MATSLQRKIRQLEELSRLQRRFVSDVSHELRTPLTTVRMAADVLHDARGEFDGATARSAELLQTELDRFESLLAELLEISRFDAGAARLELQQMDLVETAERVCATLRPLADRAGVTMSLRYASRPVRVEADPRRVDRIVRNLLSNALAHSHTDRVEVLVAGDDEAVAVAVRDHGVGLRPATRPWCSTGSGGPTPPVPAPAAAPASDWPSRWRMPSCTGGGCRPGATSRTEASSG
jgi:two-component system sensor histidine kinase MtrB